MDRGSLLSADEEKSGRRGNDCRDGFGRTRFDAGPPLRERLTPRISRLRPLSHRPARGERKPRRRISASGPLKRCTSRTRGCLWPAEIPLSIVELTSLSRKPAVRSSARAAPSSTAPGPANWPMRNAARFSPSLRRPSGSDRTSALSDSSAAAPYREGRCSGRSAGCVGTIERDVFSLRGTPAEGNWAGFWGADVVMQHSRHGASLRSG
jgi:hypothetical protein